MSNVLHNRIVQGALAGALAAALIDFNAFRAWKTWQDAAAYSWSTATWRWVQGAVTGALTAAGIGAVS